MARKRKNGEGSWGKRTINGRMYYYYKDPQGHFTYGVSEKQVKEKLKKKENEAITKAHKIDGSNKLTLGEYMNGWLYNKKFKETGLTLELSTFDCYESSISKRLYDYKIANKQVVSLDKNDFVAYLKELSTAYSRSSIKKTWQTIKMALTDDEFEFYDYVPEIKFDRIKVPNENNVAVKKKEHEFTSNEDMDILYEEALRKTSNGKDYYGNSARLLAFIMYSGLRVGEAIGLKWKDVSLERGMVTISQTYSYVHSRDEYGNSTGWQYIEKAPKSESSAATIPCRKRGIDILLLMNERTHKNTDLVFLSETNTPLTKRHVLHTLKRMLKNTGLEGREYTVHDLRHGYGSILYQEGVDIMTISRLLRHKDIQTTANIYVKHTPDALKNALDKIDKGDSD